MSGTKIYDFIGAATALMVNNNGSNYLRNISPAIPIYQSSFAMSAAQAFNDYSLASVTAPPYRGQCATVYYSGSIYVFGGLSNQNQTPTVLNDLWQYNLSTQLWTLLVANNSIGTPSQRYGMAYAVNSATGLLYIFGGNSSPTGAAPLNDLYSFNLGTPAGWTTLSPTGPAPTAAYGFFGAIVAGVFYVGTGTTNGTTGLTTNKAYTISTNAWGGTLVAISGGARWNTAYAVSGTNILVFGGQNAATTTINDFRIYSTTGNNWTSGNIASSPSARCLAGMAVIGTTMYLAYGSTTATTSLSDIYSYNITTPLFTTLSSSNGLTQTRCGFGMVTDGTSLYFFGGYKSYTTNDGCYNDIWKSGTLPAFSQLPGGMVWINGNTTLTFNGITFTATSISSNLAVTLIIPSTGTISATPSLSNLRLIT